MYGIIQLNVTPMVTSQCRFSRSLLEFSLANQALARVTAGESTFCSVTLAAVYGTPEKLSNHSSILSLVDEIENRMK